MLYEVITVAKDKSAGELIIKIANPLEKPLETEINLKDIAKLASNEARVISLAGAKNDINDLENPDNVITSYSIHYTKLYDRIHFFIDINSEERCAGVKQG